MRKTVIFVSFLFIFLFAIPILATTQNVLRPHARWWWYCFSAHDSGGNDMEICGRTRELCDAARNGVQHDHPNATVTQCTRAYR